MGKWYNINTCSTLLDDDESFAPLLLIPRNIKGVMVLRDYGYHDSGLPLQAFLEKNEPDVSSLFRSKSLSLLQY